MVRIDHPEEVYGDDRIIDKAILVNKFLHSNHTILLSEPKNIANWLKEVFKERINQYGVYCIYNKKTNEVLYIGKSKILKTRIRQQLIGTQDRKTGQIKYTRLFLGVLRKDKGLLEKDYNKMNIGLKNQHIQFFNDVIYTQNNYLKICFTENHVNALVLEEALIRYFKEKKQSRYNFFK